MKTIEWRLANLERKVLTLYNRSYAVVQRRQAQYKKAADRAKAREKSMAKHLPGLVKATWLLKQLGEGRVMVTLTPTQAARLRRWLA